MDDLLNAYKKCMLCPRNCGVDRTAGELGFCQAPQELAIASYQVHKFEEPPISGAKGSGTIFFSFCTARCAYCQNYNFSRGKTVKYISIERLSEIMLELQDKDCHNINLVTPTHYVPSIIIALQQAKKRNLNIPVLYNTNGYESLDTLKLLDGLIDIYLPDAKYADDVLAKKHCGFIDYSKYNIPALREMYRQAGNLVIDSGGIVKKGLIIRHLVLPGYLENTRMVLKLIAEKLSNDIYISFMNQYSPIIHVREHEFLCKRLTQEEYSKAKSYLDEFGFKNGWTQE